VEQTSAPPTQKAKRVRDKKSADPAIKKVDIDKLKEKTLQFKRKSEGLDPYQLLGIARDAQFNQIRTRYRAMVKEYHPDRFRQINDDEILSIVQSNFLKISDAFRVLSDPLDRKTLDARLSEKQEYTSKRKPVAPKRSPSEEAEQYYNDAMTQFKKENFERALALLRSAMYKDNANSKYIAAFALILAQNEQKLLEARGHIMKAIERDPAKGEYHAILGDIYQRGGLNTKAKYAYEKALQLDSGNQRASDGLKTLGKKPSKDTKKSIFGKFFKS
jgi:curved DNA-binding protein CbpA